MHFLFLLLFAFQLLSDANPCQTQMCSQINYQSADKQLNQSYQQILQILTKPHKEKLRISQRQWIKFRDANCDYQAFQAFGTQLYQTIKDQCLQRVTSNRTLELQALYPQLFPQKSHPNTPARQPPRQTLPLVQEHIVINPQHLIGEWLSLESSGEMEIHFTIENGQRYYRSYINSVPFEVATWQLRRGKLFINSLQRERLYTYKKATLKNDILTLHEETGGIEQYRRMIVKMHRN